MTAPLSVLHRLIEPLLAPEGWMGPALQRLEQDAFASRLLPDERAALARAARAAGADMARRARLGGRASAEESLQARGVIIHDDDGEAVSGPFVHHALYSAPPPRVTLYLRPLAMLECLLATADLRSRLGEINVREAVLAHELCHDLVHTDGAPQAVRPRPEVMRLGPWRRRAVIRAAEEIAAAGFAATWCGLAWPPELLDTLTLATWRDPGALSMLDAATPAPASAPTLSRKDAHADRTNDPAPTVRGLLAAG